MKFQWSRIPDEVKAISFQQVEWLLQGLESVGKAFKFGSFRSM